MTYLKYFHNIYTYLYKKTLLQNITIDIHIHIIKVILELHNLIEVIHYEN